MRIASPSLENWIKYYITNDDDTEYMTQYAYERWINKDNRIKFSSKALVFNYAMRHWGHKCVLDYMTYKQLLKKSGFTKIYKEEIYNSSYNLLKNIEKRTNLYTKYETLIIEAIK